MKHFFILSFISLSVVLACHSTCNCDVGSNVCKSCKFAAIGAQVDVHHRSCPCPAGWYQEVSSTTTNIPGTETCNDYEETTGYFFSHECVLGCQEFPTEEIAKSTCLSIPECKAIFSALHGSYQLVNGDQPKHRQINNWPVWIKKRTCQTSPPQQVTTFQSQCKRLINTDNQGNEIAQYMDACKIEIGQKTKNMKVLTDCHFENIGGKSYVVSDVKLDVVSANFNPVCLDTIRTKLEYKSPNTHQYIDLPAKYITNNPAGNKTIQIPLIDIFDMATSQTVTNDQIIQVVNLRIFIGHEDSWVRIHRWDLFVYTNRDQVEVFQIDVDIQETEGCQPGQECIVIADLDTVSNVYTDATFAHVHNPPHKYNVGDIFYAKIRFADPTYTKRLTFINLYFKSDTNKIFNFSSITTYSWDGNGLRISLPLVQPSQGAVIQVNMKISEQNARFLVDNEEQTVKSSFVATINENPNVASAQDSKNMSNGNILLGMSILSTLLLLF